MVTAATSSIPTPLSSAILAAITGMCMLSFLVPRYGTGVRYGLSVSSMILSRGMRLTASERDAFLKVTTPPMPAYHYPYFCTL